MAAFSISLFGSFRADLDGQPIPSFRTAKVQALLICAAAEPDPVKRESLLTLLWPGMPLRSAQHNLRQSIYHLRTIIPELPSRAENSSEDQVPLVLANRQTIQLNPESDVDIDVRQFETLFGETQTHKHVDLLTCHICHDRFEQAVAIYQGDFLVDFFLDDSNRFEEWAQLKREAYRRKALDALETLTTITTRQKDYPQARAHAERQLEIDNLRESAFHQHMEILARSGQRHKTLGSGHRYRTNHPV